MRDRFETLGAVVDESAPVEPWAFPINQTARAHDIEINLLSFTLVGEFSRLTGLVRLSAPTDVRLASVPALSISGPDGPPLVPVSAHVLPQGVRGADRTGRPGLPDRQATDRRVHGPVGVPLRVATGPRAGLTASA
jgi:hypothetical protein